MTTLPLAVTATERDFETTTDKYAFIPTTRVIEVLENAGWNAVSSKAVNPRTKNPLYVRHTVEFEHDKISALNDTERFRITVVNSHDGTTAFRFYSGLMRIICANGLAVGKSFEHFSVRHVGFTTAAVTNALTQTIEQAPLIADKVLEMKGTSMDENSRFQLYAQVAALVGLKTDGIIPELNVNQFERARRIEDRNTDLWTVFNRVQEHVIRGGLTRTVNQHGRLSYRKTRQIKSIDRSLKLNQAMWDIAETFIK